jgi:hypothetical protein
LKTTTSVEASQFPVPHTKQSISQYRLVVENNKHLSKLPNPVWQGNCFIHCREISRRFGFISSNADFGIRDTGSDEGEVGYEK